MPRVENQKFACTANIKARRWSVSDFFCRDVMMHFEFLFRAPHLN